MLIFDAKVMQGTRRITANTTPSATISRSGYIKLNAQAVKLMGLDAAKNQSIVIALTNGHLWLYPNQPERGNGFNFRVASKKEPGVLVCQATPLVAAITKALDLALNPGQKSSIRFEVQGQVSVPGTFKLA